jgi:hypothetical protein
LTRRAVLWLLLLAGLAGAVSCVTYLVPNTFIASVLSAVVGRVGHNPSAVSLARLLMAAAVFLPVYAVALQAAGLKVWVTFPCTVRQAIDLLWSIVQVFQVPQRGLTLSVLETTYEWAGLASANMERVKVFCPVWRDPPSGQPSWWMTFNGATYTHDLLRLCGGENVFAGRERRYPLAADLGEGVAEPAGDRDTRYPRVTPEEVAEHAPDIILLPSEPFAFGEADLSAFEAYPGIPAVRHHRIHLVDGSLLAWPGTRLAKALAELPSLLQI